MSRPWNPCDISGWFKYMVTISWGFQHPTSFSSTLHDVCSPEPKGSRFGQSKSELKDKKRQCPNPPWTRREPEAVQKKMLEVDWCSLLSPRTVRFGDVLKKMGGESNDCEVQQESWKMFAVVLGDFFLGLEWMFQPTKKSQEVGLLLFVGGRWVKNAWVFDMIDADIHMHPLNWFMIKLGKICSPPKKGDV